MSSWFEARVMVRSVFAGKRLLERLLSKETYIEGLTMDLHSNESAIPLPAGNDSNARETKLSWNNNYVGALTIENQKAAEWATVEVLAGAEVLSMERLFVESRSDNIISINIDEDDEGEGKITLRVRAESES